MPFILYVVAAGLSILVVVGIFSYAVAGGLYEIHRSNKLLREIEEDRKRWKKEDAERERKKSN